MGGNLLSGIKGMNVDSLACVRIKRGESEWFRIDSGVPLTLQCINVYTDTLRKVKMRSEISSGGVGRE